MVLAPCARLHSTSGGSSDTELKELAVSPTNLPAALRAVTMVTPVANMPRASRNSRGEKLGGGARTGWEQEGFTKTAAAVVRWRAAKQVGGQAGMPPLSAPARPSAVAGLPRHRPGGGGGASPWAVGAAGPVGGRAGGGGGLRRHGGGGGGGAWLCAIGAAAPFVGRSGGRCRTTAALRQRRPLRDRLRQGVAPQAPKGARGGCAGPRKPKFSAGCSPLMSSASALPEPAPWVQPSVPWPAFTHSLRRRVWPMNGMLLGVAGRRPHQYCGLPPCPGLRVSHTPGRISSMRRDSIWQRALATALSSVRSKPPSSMVPATRSLSPRRVSASLRPSSMVDTQGAASGRSNGNVAL